MDDLVPFFWQELNFFEYYHFTHHRDRRQERGRDPGGEPGLALLVVLRLPIRLLPQPVDDAQLLATVGLVDELLPPAAAAEAAAVMAEVP